MLPRRARGPAFVCRPPFGFAGSRTPPRFERGHLGRARGTGTCRLTLATTICCADLPVLRWDSVRRPFITLSPTTRPRPRLGTVRSSRAPAETRTRDSSCNSDRETPVSHVRTRFAPSVAGHAALARLFLFPLVLAFVRVIITTATADLYLVRHHETRTSPSDHVQSTVATLNRRDEEERPTDAPLISVHEPAALPRRSRRRLCHYHRIDTYAPHAPLRQVGWNV